MNIAELIKDLEISWGKGDPLAYHTKCSNGLVALAKEDNAAQRFVLLLYRIKFSVYFTDHEGIQDAREAFEIAKGIGQKEIGRALSLMAWASEEDNAIDQARQALEILTQLQDVQFLPLAHYILGSKYYESGEFASAMAHTENAYLLAEKPSDKSIVLTMLSMVLNQLQQHEAALYFAREASTINAEAGITWYESTVNNQIGVCSVRMGNYEEGLQHFKTALRIAEGRNVVSIILLSLNNIGFALSYLERHEEAEECFRKVLAIDSDDTIANMNLAYVLTKLSKIEEAKVYLDKAWDAYKHVQSSQGLISYYSVAATWHAAIQDFEKAYYNLNKFKVASEQSRQSDAAKSGNALLQLIQTEKEKRMTEMQKLRAESAEKELANTTVHLATQTEMLGNFRNELRQIVREIDEPIAALKRIKEKLKELPCEQIDWVKFEKQFTDVHPEFRSKLLEKYPELTKQEVKMCQLARLGLKSIEMAQLLCLSERSVETHRFNLRKKLALRKEQNLAEFLATIR